MPQVPRYGQERIESAGMPSVRTTPRILDEQTATAAGPLREAMGIVSDQQKMHQERVKAANQMELQDLLGQLSSQETQRKLDLQKVKGRDALEASTAALGAFDEFYGEMAKNVKSEAVRRGLELHYRQYRDSLKAWAEPYAERESLEWDNATMKALIQSEEDAAVFDYEKEGRRHLATSRIGGAVDAYAARSGMPPEQRDMMKREAVSRVYTGIVNRMLAAGDDLKAKEFYTANKAAFGGDDAAKVERAVEMGSRLGESQRIADVILNGNVVKLPGGAVGVERAKSMKEAMERISAMVPKDDPKLRDMVQDRVEHGLAIRKREDTEARNELLTEVGNIVESTRDVSQIPPDKWAELKVSERRALEMRAKQLAKGEKPETDWKLYYSLKDMASSDPNGFASENLLQYRGGLGDEEFKEMVRVQGQIKKDGKSADLSSSLGFDQMIESALLSKEVIDKRPSKLTGDDLKRFSQFRLEASKAIEAVELQKGSKATQEEKQKAVDDLLIRKVVVDRNWPWPNKERPLSLVLPDEVLLVPDAARKDIESIIKSKGKQPTEEKVQRMYRAFSAGNKTQFAEIAGE